MSTTKITFKELLKILFANVLEFYNFLLIAIFAPYIKNNFFPGHDEAVFYIYLISLAGYISRPIGGLLIGGLSDVVGRKKVILSSLWVSGLLTTIIGLLPSAAHIGMIAPIALILIRFIQGFCVSGEEGGASVYLSELFKNQRKCFSTNLVLSSVFLGILFARLSLYLLHDNFTEAQIFDYAWRIPFIISFPISLMSIYFRYNLPETVKVDTQNSYKTQLMTRLKYLFDHCKLRIFVSILTCSAYAAITNLVMVWMPSAIPEKFNQLEHTMGMLMMACLLPVLGYIYDKFFNHLFYAVVLGLVGLLTIPLLWVIFSYQGSIAISGLYTLYFCVAVLSACTMPYLLTIFPSHVRGSGVSLIFNTSVSLFSGLFPIVAMFLYQYYQVQGIISLIFGLCAISSLFALQISFNVSEYDEKQTKALANT